MNRPLPVIDWSQRRHCDSAKLAISAKIKAVDNIQNLMLSTKKIKKGCYTNSSTKHIWKVELSIKHAQIELRDWCWLGGFL